jgi:hypothetical protein
MRPLTQEQLDKLNAALADAGLFLSPVSDTVWNVHNEPNDKEETYEYTLTATVTE